MSNLYSNKHGPTRKTELNLSASEIIHRQIFYSDLLRSTFSKVLQSHPLVMKQDHMIELSPSFNHSDDRVHKMLMWCLTKSGKAIFITQVGSAMYVSHSKYGHYGHYICLNQCFKIFGTKKLVKMLTLKTTQKCIMIVSSWNYLKEKMKQKFRSKQFKHGRSKQHDMQKIRVPRNYSYLFVCIANWKEVVIYLHQ